MKKGKVSENILKRSVLKIIKDNITNSAAEGSDCAIFCGYVADEMTDNCAKHAIIRACNNAAAEGMKPLAVTLTVTMPEYMREAKLKRIIGNAVDAANEMGIVISGGHTESVEELKYPIISASVMAKKGDWKAKRANPGDSIVMTKWAAMSGGARLADKYREEIGEKYPQFIIDDAIELEQFYSILPEAAVAVTSGAICMNDCSDGGIFAALWQLADKNGVGLEVNLKDIAIRQESIEVCEFFDINPYKLRSDGALLIVTDNPESMIKELHEKEIPATVIGKIIDGIDRVIVTSEDRRFLEEPRQDEGVML